MTHGDCASGGQCELEGVEKSSGAVGFRAKAQIDAPLMFCSVRCSEMWELRLIRPGIYVEMQKSTITFLSDIVSVALCLENGTRA